MAMDAAAPLDPRLARLLDEAIDLMIRRQDAPENPVTQQTIALWRGRSPDHERIWLKVAEAHGLSGAVMGQRQAGPSVTRRLVMFGGLAGLGAATAGWGAPWLRLRLSADHMTSTAELLPLDLGDGLHVILGPDSAIAVDAPGELRLLRGMGWFELAAATRPLTLHLEGGRILRSADAGFEVSQDAGMLELGVARGDVTLALPGTELALRQGEWLRMGTDQAPPERGSRDPAMAGLWQEGIILAEAEPLAAIVARIARWLPGKVMVTDDALGEMRVSGLFDIRDPKDALAAAVRPTGARIRRVSGLLTLISAA